jgi:hypothetical protein
VLLQYWKAISGPRSRGKKSLCPGERKLIDVKLFFDEEGFGATKNLVSYHLSGTWVQLHAAEFQEATIVV